MVWWSVAYFGHSQWQQLDGAEDLAPIQSERAPAPTELLDTAPPPSTTPVSPLAFEISDQEQELEPPLTNEGELDSLSSRFERV